MCGKIVLLTGYKVADLAFLRERSGTWGLAFRMGFIVVVMELKNLKTGKKQQQA
ncbi:hypothetical protein [Pedobacter namyangjuensis]|uniref:hypothetical protein n=1 Tax=Pedobacter namyangjuensis TaxID=600626 RepID=UPI0013B431FA|nr:hypothetical protein [Pedobacter namyangjuensis]